MKKKVVVFLAACLVLLPSFVLAAAAKQPADGTNRDKQGTVPYY